MDPEWHPRPPQGTICPICSISHFPFCPPPQHPPYNHFPPHPDYPRPEFDPYPSPVGSHHPYMADPTPRHINPNFGRQYPTNPMYDYGNGNVYVNEVDRSYKRPRVDELASNSLRFLSDDERRLKLIRDHGSAFSGPPMPPPPPPPPRNAEHGYNNQKFRPNEQTDYWQEFSGSQQQQYGMQQPNYMSQNGNLGQNYRVVTQYGARNPNMNESGGYLPPLPASPPPPFPVDLPPVNHSSPPGTSHSLFPVPVSSSPAVVPSSYPLPVLPHASTGFISEESQAIHRTAMQYAGEGQLFPLKQFSPEKPTVIDASHLFKQPHRATRPDHLVIILRGLPGSGKSYLAKLLRDLEVENGGDAPRIHSMDDYFMSEVEKVEESDVSKSSSSVRSKKPVVKKVMEYCYEPEMEEAYRSSMLKAFKRTLEEGLFTFIIVDDRNLRVADFAQFWATAKRSGYGVYILEATYKDPAGCAARNVHGFTLDEIQKMAGQWEEAPSLYLQLDIKSLFHGDNLKESGIQEVDMDMGDGDVDEGLCGLQEGKPQKIIIPSLGDDAPNDPSKDGKRWDAEGDHPTEEVKELGRSKWSDDLDEDDTEKSEGVKGNINSLSGLIQAYRKEGKSVRWVDQVGNRGFSIGAAKKATMLSLVIGPGAGYNLKSNPLPEEESPSTSSTVKSKKQGMFQEQLRAERESFKAAFDRRKQRIGLDLEEE